MPGGQSEWRITARDDRSMQARACYSAYDTLSVLPGTRGRRVPGIAIVIAPRRTASLSKSAEVDLRTHARAEPCQGIEDGAKAQSSDSALSATKGPVLE